MEFGSPEFWIAVLQIIAIDILLGGDNAVVIALACRNLPERQRKLGIMWGVAGAITLRVILTIFAVTLLSIPYLKIVGAVLLAWIAIKLVLPQEGDGGHEIDASDSLVGAIKTIIIADLVMSLDNVLAVAGAAKDSWALIVFGLLVSIPIIVYCSTLVLKLMDRFPWIIILGGGLLGWIAAGMAIHDVAVRDWVSANWPWAEYALPALGASIVMAIGWYLARSAAAAKSERVAELAPGESKH
ncbi:MAG: TerC family protein [bacterium]|nr:TerC family protein [Betaproteobacteria bacterium]